MKAVRGMLRQCVLLYKKILYRIAFASNTIDDKLVVFEAFQGRSFSCNPRSMYEAMVESDEYRDFQFVWVFRDLKKHAYLNAGRNTEIVRFESFHYYKRLARAKYWVFNSNPRPFLKPKKNQIFIQTWHGTPLKRIGCDVQLDGNAITKKDDIRKNYTREAEKISYMISPSAYCTDRLISAFNLKSVCKENIVIETGYPRNDRLFQYNENDIKKLKEKYKIPSNINVILYAPTFRDNKHTVQKGFSVETGMDFGRMREQLAGEYVILFRAHYFIAQRIDFSEYEGFVYDVSNVEDVNELYIISDFLITDYSSVFFDYANLRRPILFYMYDYEEYKNQVRDFYIDVRELPGPVITEQDELITEIRKLSSGFIPDQKYRAFNDKYNYLDGPDCGWKAVQAVISNQG